ncbi:MAG: sigma-70 family RNA polymerase sigma factor [bacterium]
METNLKNNSYAVKAAQNKAGSILHSKEEFTKLVEPLFDEIYAYSLHMTRNKQQAEDLTSDTFIKAWRYFAHYKLGTNFRAWVYSILTSIYINGYRKKQKLPSIIDYDQFEKIEEFYVYNQLSKQSAQPIDDPEKIIMDKFSYQDVKNALKKLPEDFRQAVMLSDIQGFSYKEVASILKIPMGTVRSRLNRGRSFLQKQLWHYGSKSRKV